MMAVETTPPARSTKSPSMQPFYIDGVVLYLYPRWLGFDFRGDGHGEVAGKQAFLILRQLADAAQDGKRVDSDLLMRSLFGTPGKRQWPSKPRRQLSKRVCELNRAFKTHGAGFRIMAEKPVGIVGGHVDYRLVRVTEAGK